MFEQFVSPEQQEMANFINRNGGKSAINDDNIVRELIQLEDKSSFRGLETLRSKNPIEPDDLRQEIAEDPEHAIKSNANIFDKKFEVQQRQIEDLARTVRRESDRIISAVTSGPHDRIIDPVSRIL
jgi:dephospho-CoA kinase